MRIIAGRWRNRRLQSPKGQTTRPTSDRAREALFSALYDVEALHVLDLFAGTGALGLEAMSRGAASVVFVEQHRSALASLRANLKALDCPAEVLTSDVRRALKRFSAGGRRFDLILADPPYALDEAAVQACFTEARSLLAAEGTFVWEHQHARPAPAEAERSLKSGEARFSFYGPSNPACES